MYIIVKVNLMFYQICYEKILILLFVYKVKLVEGVLCTIYIGFSSEYCGFYFSTLIAECNSEKPGLSVDHKRGGLEKKKKL